MVRTAELTSSGRWNAASCCPRQVGQEARRPRPAVAVGRGQFARLPRARSTPEWARAIYGRCDPRDRIRPQSALNHPHRGACSAAPKMRGTRAAAQAWTLSGTLSDASSVPASGVACAGGAIRFVPIPASSPVAGEFASAVSGALTQRFAFGIIHFFVCDAAVASASVWALALPRRDTFRVDASGRSISSDAAGSSARAGSSASAGGSKKAEEVDATFIAGAARVIWSARSFTLRRAARECSSCSATLRRAACFSACLRRMASPAVRPTSWEWASAQCSPEFECGCVQAQCDVSGARVRRMTRCRCASRDAWSSGAPSPAQNSARLERRPQSGPRAR